MKKIYKLLAFFGITALILAGCSQNNEDYEVPYDDYSSFQTFTTGGDFGTFDRAINVDDYLSFHDVSQNVIDHKWTIPESAWFLNGDFTRNDSVYDKFIIQTSSKVSEEKLINVLFKEPGLHEVKLFNIFKHEVENAVNVNGKWVIDQVFNIDVFARTNPACKVYKYDYSVDPDNPTLVEVLSLTEAEMPSINDKSSWPTVSIEAGEELMFEDLSTTGTPTSRRFYLEGGKPEQSNQQQAVIKYNKLGNYTAWMESIRSGAEVPSYTGSKLIPLNIEIIPSTKPFEIGGGVTMNTDGVISFAVTGEVETLVNEEGNFTVHVTNSAAGFDQNIPVASAKINEDDATVIELTLADPTFNTDEIEISFSGGNIASVDSRTLLDFGPKPVKIDLGNSILVNSWASFETEDANWKRGLVKGYWVGNSNDDGSGGQAIPVFGRTTEMASEGDASMRFTFDFSKNMKLQGSDFSKPNGIPAGTYHISYKVYLPAGNTIKSFRNALLDPFMNMVWDIENVERGKWVEISRVETIGSDIRSGTRFDLAIDTAANPGVTGEQTMYFDDLKWIPLDPRP
ncbi:hypothetical protein [Seonamhaeicola maritimus]|uniref:hypothetical protein n=1 Tax=Seonamhaeicola maritimus TaxID=2591822 RepID=UPI002494E896|nr:hypothetical protein [Seonamhaeicola maritimus]